MCKSNKVVCPRCGGSGKVEHSHVMDGVCFMCGGFGEVYPKRVEELTEKAKIRKANREAKYQKELAEQKEADEKYWGKVYAEITKRNKKYFEEYKCATHKGAMEFYTSLKGMSKHLGFNSETSEEDFRDMIKNFYKDESFRYRLELSKYTLKYHNFCFVDLDGRKTDLTECMHEVQCSIKRYN